MIEIGLKYKISSVPTALANYPLIGEKSQVDVYYDGPDYAGYTTGNFLRLRNGRRLDFKLNLGDKTHLFCNELNFDVANLPEKSDEFNRSLKLLGVPATGRYADLDDMLAKNGLAVLGRIEKRRREYKIDDKMKVAVDEAKDIGAFLEAEIMAEGDVGAGAAKKLKEGMIAELRRLGLLPSDARRIRVGYLELYLYEHNWPVYEIGLYKDYNPGAAGEDARDISN